MSRMNQKGADAQLSVDQSRSLRALAGTMIPASKEFVVPGADDEVIFADIERSAARGSDAAAVAQALLELDAVAEGGFAELNRESRIAAAERFRSSRPGFATVLVNLIVACYYRDDRVMRSLGMEPRPPFPKGFALESGDWSLLDPVRARGKIYREIG